MLVLPMATLLSRLPAPVHNAAPSTTAAEAPSSSQALARVGGAPPYGSRASFVPRKPADFGDGGAYPECHVAQYPLDCGRKGASGGTKSSVVNVHVDEHGALDYSAIVTQGTSAKKTIATKHNSVLPRIHDLTEEVRVRAPHSCAWLLTRTRAGPGPAGPGAGGRIAGGHSRGH